MSELPCPEVSWGVAQPLLEIGRDEVDERVGPTSDPLRLMPGGLANRNVLIGEDRVLRIYDRRVHAVDKERALLSLPWGSFRVPSVLDWGPDFLLLEYVSHRPLTASARDGSAVGRALAEVHAHRYEQPGSLGANAQVERVYPSVIDEWCGGVLRRFEDMSPFHGDLRDPVLSALRKVAPFRAEEHGHIALLHGDFKSSNLHRTRFEQLLVLDWEFAYAGPAMADIGQLLRWLPPADFVSAFERGYLAGGGFLPNGWESVADLFDLFNLVGVLAKGPDDPHRTRDVRRRIEKTLASKSGA